MHCIWKRIAPVFMCAVTATAAMPAVSVSAGTAVPQVSYEDTESLQERFEHMLAGEVNMYMDDKKTPIPGGAGLGAVLDNSQRYYVFSADGETMIAGKQCYIVAQAFYGALFDEFVLHADEEVTYDHSEIVLGLTEGISYDLFFEKQIKPGAYIRTTADKTGKYDNKNGHSMMILGYDYSNVTILEGNGDAKGLIRIWTITYEKFNAYYLARKDRVIAHVVQPTAAYYKKKFGYVSPTVKEDPPIEPEYDYQYFAMHRLGSGRQLTKPEDGMTWTSSDPEVVSVDENGIATVHSDGYVQITGDSERYKYTFNIEASPIPWETVGDADNSGSADMEDAKTILLHCTAGLVGDRQYLNYSDSLRYDVNDDGIVNLTDARLTLCYHVMQQITFGASAQTLWEKVYDS